MTHVKLLTTTVLTLLISAVMLPAQAANTGSGAGTGRTYSAVAVAEESRAFGYSVNQSTRNKAKAVALRECRKHANDCKIEMTSNICLAFARAKSGAWGVSRRNTKFKSRNAAMKNCREHSRGCKIEFATCNRGA